jgi:hypothetical protein
VSVPEDGPVGFDGGVIAQLTKPVKQFDARVVHQWLATREYDVSRLFVVSNVVDDTVDIHPGMGRFPRGVVGITEPAPEITSTCSDEDCWYTG